MKNQAFTLIELLVVVLIIGILAAIAVPQYQKAVLKSKYVRAKESVNEIIKAYELYYLQHGTYPTKFSELDFANKFDNDYKITSSGGYVCQFNGGYNEIICNIDETGKVRYIVNFYTYNKAKITRHCRTDYVDENSIYRKLCKEETGKNGDCSSTRCDYSYAD